MSRSASCKTPAETILPFLIDLSNVFVIVVAFIQWINQFGENIISLNTDLNRNMSQEQYDYLDEEAQPQVTITSRLLTALPKTQGNYKNYFFPKTSVNISKTFSQKNIIIHVLFYMYFSERIYPK